MKPIITYPNPVLRQVSDPVDTVNREIHALMDEMAEAMYHDGGVGLAAPQVGILRRIIVLDIGEGLQYYINPEIIDSGSEKVTVEEGCLSLPGIHVDVTRPDQVTVKAMIPSGKTVEMKAEGLLARVFQHEIDHLNGVLLIDHASSIQRTLLKTKLKKLEKQV